MLRRALRVTRRILLGLVGVVAVAILGVVIFVHTDTGRDVIRKQINKVLASTFVGGGSIGRLEGSPFGELVARNLVLNTPDGKPAITAKTVRARIKLTGLLDSLVRVETLVVEDVDVKIERDPQTGEFPIAGMLAPSDEPMTWDLELPKVDLVRAHVLVDGRNLDAIHATASATIPAKGDKQVKLALAGRWRERDVPFAITTELSDDATTLTVPSLALSAGAVVVTGQNLMVVRRGEKLPAFQGALTIVAPRDAVAKLEPSVSLPDDITVAIAAAAPEGDIQPIVIDGSLGATPFHLETRADLIARTATGAFSTGELDLAKLTGGKVLATAGGRGTFTVDVLAERGTVDLTGEGTFEDLPRTSITLAARYADSKAHVELSATGAATANVVADLEREGETIRLTSSQLTAKAEDIGKFAKMPQGIDGNVEIAVAVSGTLAPALDLAAQGTVAATKVRANELRVASANIAFDVAKLPSSPRGSSTIAVLDVRQANKQVVASATVALRAQTPDTDGDPILVDLVNHRVAANGYVWSGANGRVAIVPETRAVTLRGFSTRSAVGAAQVSGWFRAGDFGATVDFDKVALRAAIPKAIGTFGGHLEVSRVGTKWTGVVDVTGKDIIVKPTVPPLSLAARVEVGGGRVHVAASATNADLGNVKLALELDPPRDLTDVAAWRKSGRGAITDLQLALEGIDLGKIAKLAAPEQQLAGRIDGLVSITATTATGTIRVRGVKTPLLRGIEQVDVDIGLVEELGELVPRVTVAATGVGKATAAMRIAMPKRVFDPAAWQALGLGALRCGWLRTDPIDVDPALLDRLGIEDKILRTKARIAVDVGEGARTAKAVVLLDDLRGTPIARPVDVRVELELDGKDAHGTLVMRSRGAAVAIASIDARVPLTSDQLRAGIDLNGLPIFATVDFAKTSAAQLMNVFGRTEISAGTLDGKISITGTIGAPTVKAHLEGLGLEVPPSPRGKPVQTLEKVTLDATWNENTGGKVLIDGSQDGGGKLHVEARGSPRALDTATAKIVATKFDLAPLLAFAPGPAGGTQGTLDANLAVTGFDPKVAKVVGELHIKDARIPIAPQVGTLRRANIDIAISEQAISIKAAGRLGPGEIKVEGKVDLKGVELAGGEIKATLRKVSPIGDVEPLIDADVSLKVKRTPDAWVADVLVERGLVVVRKTSGERLKPIGTPDDMTIGAIEPGERLSERRRAATKDGDQDSAPPVRPSLVANIIIRPIRVESEELRTSLSGNLKITADTESIGMVGQITAGQGDLDLFDRRYKVERAVVTFDGTIDPRLDVQITHDFSEVTTITTVRGRASKPELILTSDPGTYSPSQLLGFLLGGEPNGDPTSSSARSKAVGVSASFIADQIGGYFRKALPFDIDVLRYEAASASSSAAITVGTWVTNTLFVAFRQRLDARPDENRSEGSVEYWISRRVQVEVSAGDRNINEADILWRKRF